jgi:DNA-binding CsgD family transcriptional regulator
MLQLLAGIGDRETIIKPLAGLGELASVYGQPETAATLVGAVDALVMEAGDFIQERFIRFAGDNRDRAAARACAALGEARFADLCASGLAMPLEEAVAVAATVTIRESRSASFPASTVADPLTAREHEVLRLIAQARTDQEIADTFFLSRRTINAHVVHILAKLDARSRQEAAIRARELGLLPEPGAPVGHT